MSKVLILSELWYPQGGGAELATFLYANEMSKVGSKVTIATNQDSKEKSFDACQFATLPISKSTSKARLLFESGGIKKRIYNLAMSHDTAYVPGKLVYLVPWLRKANSSLKILVHLHDYQLVCPHASLYNFMNREICDYIWSDLDCARCTWKFERAQQRDLLASAMAPVSSLYWKHSEHLQDILSATNSFITVSKAQTDLIAGDLGEYGQRFLEKNAIIPNPMDETIHYVTPSFDNSEVKLGFFGGDKYLKGFQEALEIVRNSPSDSLKLFASRVMREHFNHRRFEFTYSLSKEEMDVAFKNIWIVLFTSLAAEPSPYVVMESQLRGRPVITTSLGGAPESIAEPGLTGTMVSMKAEFKEDLYKIIEEYALKLRESPLFFTKEISEASREFFERRTRDSYNAFVKLI